MKLDHNALAHLPRSLELSFTCTVGELLDAMAKGGDVPEAASTVELSRAWGFPARKWREWAASGLIEGATVDEGGSWRLPREAAREQFERALGRDVPRPARTSHLPRRHGPRKNRRARP
jgi:hypothetical protein